MGAANSTEVALARLARAEALTEETQRIAGVGTWQFDTASGLVIWSAELFRIFGFTPANFHPSLDGFIGCVHPDDREAMLAVVEATVGGEPMDHTHRIVRPDGEVRYVHARARVVVLETGGGPVMVGTVQDITDRRNSEALISAQTSELKEMQAELIYLARQSAMGTMAATLAHEVNQPLTAISNYAAGVRLLVAHIPRAREGVEEIERNASRAGEVIRHLREMTRRGPTTQRVADLGQVIRDAAGLVAKGACSGVELEYHIGRAQVIDADPIQIGQVVINLVQNACESVADAKVKKIVIATYRDGGAVRVDVIDSGSGIAADLLPKLFESGQSAKPRGMGIGLSISRTIVESHGGRIGAENVKGGGARFWFTIPLLERAE